jgi:hypothetical protein
MASSGREVRRMNSNSVPGNYRITSACAKQSWRKSGSEGAWFKAIDLFKNKAVDPWID